MSLDSKTVYNFYSTAGNEEILNLAPSNGTNVKPATGPLVLTGLCGNIPQRP